MNVRRFTIAGTSAAVLIVAGATVLNLLPASAFGFGSAAPGAHPAHTASAPHTPGKRLSTEVLPPTAKFKVPVLPRSKPLPALSTGPIPKSAHARGKLVAGFPGHLPAAPGSHITTSSVSSSDGKMQVTVDATYPRSPQDLVAYYQSALGKYGLSATSLPAVGGSTAWGFSNGSTSLTLTVTPSGKHGSRYLLFGVLSPQN